MHKLIACEQHSSLLLEVTSLIYCYFNKKQWTCNYIHGKINRYDKIKIIVNNKYLMN